MGGGFANALTFVFMHHPYLVCILFGMPSLHIFTFFLVSILFCVNLSYSKEKYGNWLALYQVLASKLCYTYIYIHSWNHH